jgi:hypothetical protein
MLLAEKILRPAIAETEARLDSALLHRFLKGLGREPNRGSLHGIRLDPAVDAAEAAGMLLRSAMTNAFAAEVIRRLAASLTEKPRWVEGAQELWWLGRRVKSLRRAADNLGVVLTAFEARLWPRRIGDPLLWVAGRNAKVRRRETVRGLNEGLAPGTIRFHADGMKGIRWEEVVEGAETSPSHHP